MNRSWHALAALVLSIVACLASAADTLKSPEVSPDGRVTFRFADTGARKVLVSIANVPDPLPMTMKDGIWSVTTMPMPPEVYWYSFIVDGRPVLDPVNPDVRPNLVYLDSIVTVPSPTLRPWDLQDVPHGVVHHHTYTTHVAQGIAGNQGGFYVYTPPGYDPAAKKPYPVLYLLHGYGSDAESWITFGGVDRVLDSLISQGKARPMVVVMPFGYGDMTILKDYESHVDRNDALFERVLLGEVMPQVEAAYHVSPRPEDRAIAGLSMGGDQSVRIGLTHPALFSSVGCFSGASDFIQAAIGRGDYDAAKANLRVLWVGSGTGEGEGLAHTRMAIAALRARGFTVSGLEAPGMHTWNVWHPDLVDFVPRLFR